MREELGPVDKEPVEPAKGKAILEPEPEMGRPEAE
jgi:hypothetical protein